MKEQTLRGSLLFAFVRVCQRHVISLPEMLVEPKPLASGRRLCFLGDKGPSKGTSRPRSSIMQAFHSVFCRLCPKNPPLRERRRGLPVSLFSTPWVLLRNLCKDRTWESCDSWGLSRCISVTGGCSSLIVPFFNTIFLLLCSYVLYAITPCNIIFFFFEGLLNLHVGLV